MDVGISKASILAIIHLLFQTISKTYILKNTDNDN